MKDFFKNLFGQSKTETKKPKKKAKNNKMILADKPKVKFFQIIGDDQQSLIQACQLAKACGLSTIYTDNSEYQSIINKFKHLKASNASSIGLGVLLSKNVNNDATVVDIVSGSGDYNGTNLIMGIEQNSETLEGLCDKYPNKVIAFVPKGHSKDYFCGLRRVDRVYFTPSKKNKPSPQDQMVLFGKIQSGTVDLLDIEELLSQSDSIFASPLLKTMGINLSDNQMKDKMMGQFSSLTNILKTLTIKEKKNSKLLSEESRIARINKHYSKANKEQIEQLNKLVEQLNKMGANIMGMLSNPSKMTSMLASLKNMMNK